MTTRTRRQFLQEATVGGAAVLVASHVQPFAVSQPTGSSPWKSRIGLELYTVRDRLMTDYEGTLAKVAEIGYTEVEPTSYNNMSPKDYRAMLDRLKLTMPSTHAPARGTGADLERQLEGFQVMGIKYTEIAAPVSSSGASTPDSRRPSTLPPGAYFDAGTGRVRNSFKEIEAFGPYQPPVSLESVKQRAAQLNADGRIAQKFDMKVFVHNHTGEFEKLTDSPRTTFDVLLEKPIRRLSRCNWISAGRTWPASIRLLVQVAPGPLRAVAHQGCVRAQDGNPSLGPNARVSSMAIVPVGSGHIDFMPAFAQAQLAGLKHFVIEQDNAAAWGDSLAAARVSYQNLSRMLT